MIDLHLNLCKGCKVPTKVYTAVISEYDYDSDLDCRYYEVYCSNEDCDMMVYAPTQEEACRRWNEGKAIHQGDSVKYDQMLEEVRKECSTR